MVNDLGKIELLCWTLRIPCQDYLNFITITIEAKKQSFAVSFTVSIVTIIVNLKYFRILKTSFWHIYLVSLVKLFLTLFKYSIGLFSLKYQLLVYILLYFLVNI